jgi:hypothetical protein
MNIAISRARKGRPIRVVELLAGEAAGVLHQVDHDVLAQEVRRALGRRGDLRLVAGLLDLRVDGRQSVTLLAKSSSDSPGGVSRDTGF